MIIKIQKYPKQLKPNCLLTRYPLCFIHGVKNFINFYNYWHDIPLFLKNHGYEVYDLRTNWRGNNRLDKLINQFDHIFNKHTKVHVFAHSLGTLDALRLHHQFKNKFESLTLISPPYKGTPWAHFGKNIFSWLNDALTEEAAQAITHNFLKSDTFVTTILSDPQFGISRYLKLQHKTLIHYLKSKSLDPRNDGLIPLVSQLPSKDFSDKVILFPGDHLQVIGAAPWPNNQKTAHEVILDQCIFLAERDLQNAK